MRGSGNTRFDTGYSSGPLPQLYRDSIVFKLQCNREIALHRVDGASHSILMMTLLGNRPEYVPPKSWTIAHKPPEVFHIVFQALIADLEVAMSPSSIDKAGADDLVLLVADLVQSSGLLCYAPQHH
jgi:hypothetical protein